MTTTRSVTTTAVPVPGANNSGTDNSVTPPDSSKNMSESESLGKQARIGIGLGVSIVLIALVLLSAWVLRNFRARRLAPQKGTQELDSTYTSVWKRFVASAWRAELEAPTGKPINFAELEASGTRHELESKDYR